jgi:hypothetical protein
MASPIARLHAVDSISEQKRATILGLAGGVNENPGSEQCGKKAVL